MSGSISEGHGTNSITLDMENSMTKKLAGKARSAVIGRYVKKSYTANNPNTTVIERDKSKGGGKGKM